MVLTYVKDFAMEKMTQIPQISKINIKIQITRLL
jgi:hypothetical protein